jgi:hypothetical protein
MAWLRLLVLVLVGGVASAHPQPPHDLDDPLYDRGDLVGRMRPPPPMDPNEILVHRLERALARAVPDVQACTSQLRLEKLEVRVAIGVGEPAIFMASLPTGATARCVKRMIAASIRATFGPRFQRRPRIETTFRYVLRLPPVVDGFSQPPP